MIYLGSDHNGYALKQSLLRNLVTAGYQVTDCGDFTPDAQDNFTDYVNPVVNGVLSDSANRGILICGSGIGMSIAANHYRGIRAALVHDVNYAQLCRQHNDANVLCLGAKYLDDTIAQEIVNMFLTTLLDTNPKYKQRMNQADGSMQ